MESTKKFIPVHELEVYRLARKLSSMAWGIYQRLAYQQRKVWGDQMLESVDSVGANVAGRDMLDFIFPKKRAFITYLEHLYPKVWTIGLI